MSFFSEIVYKHAPKPPTDSIEIGDYVEGECKVLKRMIKGKVVGIYKNVEPLFRINTGESIYASEVKKIIKKEIL